MSAFLRRLFDSIRKFNHAFVKAPDGRILFRDPLSRRRGFLFPDAETRRFLLDRYPQYWRVQIIPVLFVITVLQILDLSPRDQGWLLYWVWWAGIMIVGFVVADLLERLLFRRILKDLEQIPLPAGSLPWDPPPRMKNAGDPHDATPGNRRRFTEYEEPRPTLREALRDIAATPGWQRWAAFIALCLGGLVACVIRAAKGISPDGSIELAVVLLALGWMATYMLYRKAEDGRFGSRRRPS